MVNFGWEAQKRRVISNWSKTEKVRKKFIMKTFSILSDQVRNELPSKSSPYKGPIRIVLAAYSRGKLILCASAFVSVSERLPRNRRNGGSAAAQSPATQTNQRRWSMGYPGNLPAPLGMPLWCLASLSRPNCSPALTNVPVGLYGEKS